MSDKYEIDGVTVAPAGGGWYELTAPGQEATRVQGKENADAKAKEIGATLKSSDSTIEQPPIDQAAAALANGKPVSDDEATKDEQIAALQAQLADRDRDLEALTKAGANVAQVLDKQAEGEVLSPGQVPAAISRNFAGDMDKDSKAQLKKAGFGTVRIVLEENESIPPTGLYIGHNGRGYMIKPGEEVEVPDFLLGVLDDAVTSTPTTDGKSGKVTGWRNRSKYPYRRV